MYFLCHSFIYLFTKELFLCLFDFLYAVYFMWLSIYVYIKSYIFDNIFYFPNTVFRSLSRFVDTVI